MLKSSTSEDSNKLARSHDHGVMLLPDLAKEIKPKLENNSSSSWTQIDLKPKSSQIGTPFAQPIFRLRNSSSVYRQMIRSIYESSLDRLLHDENQLVTASQEAHVFDKYPDPVESPQDSLDFITNALAKMHLKSCRSHILTELLDNLREVASIDDLLFQHGTQSKLRGKLAPVELS